MATTVSFTLENIASTEAFNERFTLYVDLFKALSNRLAKLTNRIRY